MPSGLPRKKSLYGTLELRFLFFFSLLLRDGASEVLLPPGEREGYNSGVYSERGNGGGGALCFYTIIEPQ